MSDSRQTIMRDIALADYPEAHDLDEAQLADYLRDYIQRNSRSGVLNSRRDVPKLMQLVVAHLVDLGLTDQNLFEQLYETPGYATDEYRVWSSEYSFPISNNQASKLASFDTWDDVIAAYTSDPDSDFSAVMGISTHEPGMVLVWTHELSTGLLPTEYLSEGNWLVLKSNN